ncbi:MAG: hypothetical protein L0154_03085 [Chloroflexi bacterium]|nr:hypothetical protein [Chloroflexota bacterium]
MRLIAIILICVLLIPVAAPTQQAKAQAADCFMAVEIFKVTPLKDRGDAVHGLFGGDMEFQLQVVVTNGLDIWEGVYPENNKWVEGVEVDKEVETDGFYILIDMQAFTDSELYIYFLAIDMDPVNVFGYDLSREIKDLGTVLLKQAIRLLLPEDISVVADTLIEEGVEAFVEDLTKEDIIGQGGIYLDEENGWGTSEIVTFTTPDEGLEIEYQVYLIGENCSTDKQSV